MIPFTPELPVEDLSSVSCGGCGLYDATLRYSSHPTVISTIVTASESARVGIWCARCRGIEAAKATAVTVLAGWWSVRGPKLAIAAIQANLAGGRQTAGTNARMLRGIAALEASRGNPEMAATFAAAAHAVQPQRENSRLMDDLRRAGHRASVSNSPWRFAAWAPIVLAAVLVSVVLIKIAPGGDDDDKPEPKVQRAALTDPAAAPASPRVPTFRKPIDFSASPEQMEKELASNPDPMLAEAYFNARLRAARSEILPRIRRGDDLQAMRASIQGMRSQPAVMKYLTSRNLAGPYESLCATFDDATQYYHGGAPVEAIERTAGESLDTTLNIALHAIVADMRGHDERRDALVSQVDARAQSLELMRQDLRIRGAVVALTTRAIDACLRE